MSIISIFTYILRLIVVLPLSWISGPIFIICELLSHILFGFFLLGIFYCVGSPVRESDKIGVLVLGILSFIFYIIPRTLIGIVSILDPTND